MELGRWTVRGDTAPFAAGRRQAACWVYVRDDRPAGSAEPPVVWYRYLREVLARIADHPINRIDELLPWNIGQRVQEQRRAA